MAQLVIAAAGAAIGGLTLGTGVVALGMTGTAIGWAVGSVVGSMFGPKQKGEGPRLGDLTVTSSAYGTPIPYVLGSPRLAGQIIWASNKREIATTTEQGKGGGGSEYTSYTYEVDALILLSDNVVPGIDRIWQNGDLAWNKSASADPATIAASDAAPEWRRITFYDGNPAQLPDPTYEAAVGSPNAPAYRGRGSVFIEGWQLGSSGQIHNETFEIKEPVIADVDVGAKQFFGAGISFQVIALDDDYALVTNINPGYGGYVYLVDTTGAAPVILHTVNFLSPGDVIYSLTRIDATSALLHLKLNGAARSAMMILGRSGLTATYGGYLMGPVGMLTGGRTSQLDATRFVTIGPGSGGTVVACVTTVAGSSVSSIGSTATSSAFASVFFVTGAALGASSAVAVITHQPAGTDLVRTLAITASGPAITFGSDNLVATAASATAVIEPLGGTAFVGVLQGGDARAAVITGAGGAVGATSQVGCTWNSAGFGPTSGFGVFLDAYGDRYVCALDRSGAPIGALKPLSLGYTTAITDTAVAPGGKGIVVFQESGNVFAALLT